MSSKVIRKERCPECAKHGRDVSSDNLAVYDDGHSYCYSCQYFQPSDKEPEEQFTYEYLPRRGITRATYEFYGAKTKIDASGKPVAIGYPYANGSYKVRDFSRKRFHSVGEINRAGLYGKDKFPAGGPVLVITEGEEDAHTIYQCCRVPAVSVQSASSAERDIVLDYDYCVQFDRVLIAFDDDVAGRSACATCARLFEHDKVRVVKFHPRKDANEWLQLGMGDDLRTLVERAKRYVPETIVNSFSDFRGILQGPKDTGIPYPWPALNAMTYGIRPGESVLITAPEKVGKTELMHFIEYQLLTETKDAIGAIYLEEPKRRHLQALASIHLGRPVHLPDCDCSDAEVAAAVEAVVQVDERLHIYNHFGTSDPDVIIDTIRFLVTARNCRYILLDHLTMVVSGAGGEADERRALDYIATKLEMMVKELNFALILVSHVNDDGKTRGSRYISKVCDIRIDAARDLTSHDPVQRNTTRLTVSLNRFSGLTGPADELVFDLPTYSFRVVSDREKEERFNEEAAKLLMHIVETGPLRGSHADRTSIRRRVEEMEVA